MRKTILLFAVVVIFLLTIPAAAFDFEIVSDTTVETLEEPVPAPTFSDIAGHWAESTIIKYKDAGIVNGYPDGTFQPDKPITRAELAKIVTLALGLTETSELTYTDIDVNEWYYPYLQTAAAYIPSYASADVTIELMFYQQQNCFFPNASALRMHAAETFSLMKMEHEGITVEFPDFGTVYEKVNELFADWQYDNTYIMRPSQGAPINVRRQHNYTWLAYELGIMHGDPSGYFRPFDGLTRAEVLTVIDRIFSVN